MKRSTLSAAASIALLSISTAAGAYSCSGPVRGVSIEVTSGDVLVENLGNVSWPRLCNVRVAANGIAPESCKVMYASLLTAQANGKAVSMSVSDPATSCTTLVPWQWVKDFYFLRIEG